MSYRKLLDISEFIVNYDKLDINPGFMTGNAGIALSLFHLEELKKDNICFNRAYELLDKVFEGLNQGYSMPTYCDGLAGICATISHLEKKQIIENGTFEEVKVYDQFFFETAIKMAKDGNIDFLHGAVGIFIYLLDRLDNKDLSPFFYELLEILKSSSQHEKSTEARWLTVVTKDDEGNVITGYNLALSHGSASIIYLLAKACRNNICYDESKSLLERVVNHLLKQKVNPNKLGCYFAPEADDDLARNRTSRLAWCYGDPGICSVLYLAGKWLNRLDWQAEALSGIELTFNRRDIEQEYVYDAGICHGSAGLAMIYNRWYLHTNDIKFKEARDYWLNITLEMSKYPDGYCGYKLYRDLEHGGPIAEVNLLEGVAGIALVMQSCLSGDSQDWDELFLLS